MDKYDKCDLLGISLHALERYFSKFLEGIFVVVVHSFAVQLISVQSRSIVAKNGEGVNFDFDLFHRESKFARIGM